jgi:aspartyl-tRNA(Asn)/glutamyl-tRNA(Gln) amidotransferase subunit B
MADFFEETVKLHKDPKTVSNWILGEFSFHLNRTGLDIEECAVTPKHLAEMLKMIEENIISSKIAKEVFAEMFETGKLPQVIVEERGLVQIVDEKEISQIIDLVLEEHQKAVEDIKKGKSKAIGFLVGQVMRLTKGKANPQLVNKILRQKLS